MLNPDNAVVMIPRKISSNEASDTTNSNGVEQTDHPSKPPTLDLGNKAKAIPTGGQKRQQVKNRDWKSSVQAYNDL